jgi:hypothetical protein
MHTHEPELMYTYISTHTVMYVKKSLHSSIHAHNAYIFVYSNIYKGHKHIESMRVHRNTCIDPVCDALTHSMHALAMHSHIACMHSDALVDTISCSFAEYKRNL